MFRKKPKQQDIPKWVQVKIDKVRDNHLDVLDISSSHGQPDRETLTHIPDSILELVHLRTLNLMGHSIQTIPPQIARLINLKELSISGSFVKIPDSLGQLKELSSLHLSGDNKRFRIPIPDLGLSIVTGAFDTIPDTLWFLPNLKQLSLWGQFSFISQDVGRLTQLESLMLGAPFEEIPAEISLLNRLKELSLLGSYNKLPGTFNQLTKLSHLMLCAGLTTIPSVVFELTNLVELDLRHTSISTIPPEILKLKNLDRLAVPDTIQDPPPEIVRKDDRVNLEAIRNYYRGIEEEQDHLYEAKLLILGEGGAGKTTLRRKIQDPQCTLLNEKSTEGIDVQRWDFPIPDKRDFRVNLWDFGGQEIYHATHQFFLTNRSLYALVADNRKEDTDFYYWLNIIELLGGDSPILIIKNEKQDRARQIGEPQLRARFKNIVGIVATNFNTNRGLDALLDEIKLRMRQLPHVGTPLPRSWVQVRQALEADSSNYIQLEAYYDLCVDYGMVDRSMQDTVISYLHDLGVCLHFRTDPVLKHFVILKPQWGTSAVYTVLDNKQVIRNRGLFTRADLETIWTDPTYDGMHDELLHLMMRFKLCYEIPGKSQQYMAPQLLSEDQSHYEWDGADNRYLRFRYEFMPKGLVTRLIVALNRLIDGKKMWKTGVILKKGQTSAEVIEHYQDKQIHIRLRGSDKQGLLAIIMHEMEEIHQSYPGMKYHTLVPCNCDQCTQSEEPFFFSFEQLQRALGKSLVQCVHSFEMIDPGQLVYDALPSFIDRRRAELTTGFSNYGTIETLNLLTGGTFMEQGRNKFDNRISGNVQAGNLNQGEQSFGDNANITLNVNALPDTAGPMAELKALIEQLQNALQQLPTEQAEDAQLVQECADEAIEEAAKEEPNRRRLEIKGKSLIEAAKNLAAVTPIAVEIAKKLLLLA